ncbi:hypothetical protein [Hymenobacter properus]|uniref:Uncharacterized protein n=1 Tax=Hymenobacter properus TaxID=2791026 RepID=A0A931BJI3_9BACT|nr:hypothetical protein [Hymenobacter properus]MBF9143447.1 hypothetical protein [Hymenobacter properus]MBR7722260.1 hypothetical protein [Microvirga sp. SRT04]
MLPNHTVAPPENESLVDKIYRSPMWVFLLFSTVLSVWYFIFPDIIPLHHGFAWEGDTYYKPVATGFPHQLFDVGINSYTIQRILPFALLYGFFKTFNIPFLDQNLILWMQGFNLLLGAIIVYAWHRIAVQMRFSLAAEWVGYLALMVNFAFAKYDLYIPFTTDRLSTTVGLISLLLYLRGKTLGLWLNALISLAIWPTALFYNALLLFIPREEPLPRTQNPLLSQLWAVGIAGAFSLLFIGVLYVRHVPVPPRMTPDVHPLLPVSIALTALYLYYTQLTLARRVLPGWADMWGLIKRLLRPRIEWLYVLGLFAAYVALTRGLGDPSRPYLPFKTFLINTTFAVLQRPLQFLVAHGVYYGLSLLLMILFWPRVLAALQRLGLGLGLMLMVVMVQSINSETRQLANVLPLLALVTAVVADALPLRRAAIVWTAALLLLVSKLWLPFNWFDPTFGQSNDRFPSFSFVHTGIMLHWPFQVYFMNQGPWISNEYLLGQAVALVIVGFVVYRLFGAHRSGSESAN